jgi:hypothetical protein
VDVVLKGIVSDHHEGTLLYGQHTQGDGDAVEEVLGEALGEALGDAVGPIVSRRVVSGRVASGVVAGVVRTGGSEDFVGVS